MLTRYIFVTGGVCSSLGKGITAASLGRLLISRGFRVTVQKLDPYLNIDPGTMSPYQHGEVFVTTDGAETDLDLGHYERFTASDSSRFNSITSGQVYQSVLNSERKGDYLGSTVQIIPHVTDRIKECIVKAGLNSSAEIVITEIGGTVGDIESLPFLEAIRQFKRESGHGKVMYVHVTLLPNLQKAGEMKSKPTQHSVKELRALGILPDMLVCRCEETMPDSMKKKLSLMCDVREDSIFNAPDVASIYEVPLNFESQNMTEMVIKHLELKGTTPQLENWRKMVEKINAEKLHTITIALAGKYVELKDAYLSIREALAHSATEAGVELRMKYLTSGFSDEDLEDVDAILVPGGFGERGTESKIQAIRYAREKGIPFLGICLGMQLAVIEFARNVAGIADADSMEFNENTSEPIIALMADQHNQTELGATMRLGHYPCQLKDNSKLQEIYGSSIIQERHRHRYEMNNSYRERLRSAGLNISGTSPDNFLVEAVEITEHPFFVAVQYHPEFQSRPLEPHPLFSAFVNAAFERVKNSRESKE